MRRAPLVALCTALSIALLVAIVENFGLGSKTLLGFWDCVFTPGPAPYTLRASGVVPGGAAALGGLHDGWERHRAFDPVAERWPRFPGEKSAFPKWILASYAA